MNLPKKLRNIAKTQINAIKDRLDRIEENADEEAVERAIQRRYERDARAELDDNFGPPLGPSLRTPEEIAAGKPRQPSSPAERAGTPAPKTRATAPAAPSRSAEAPAAAPVNPLAHHYRVLGVEEGADYPTVQAAYSKLAARCTPERFPEGSDERKTADEIRKRVDASYDALRDALDATAGRFDKLEF
jgi:hypothetical protein